MSRDRERTLDFPGPANHVIRPKTTRLVTSLRSAFGINGFPLDSLRFRINYFVAVLLEINQILDRLIIQQLSTSVSVKLVDIYIQLR